MHSITDEEASLADKRSLAFPDGWFQVGYSDELAVGEIHNLAYFGRKLVLFRTEQGRAQVLGAYCAHLGAHIGVGGTVSGDRIVCPFHGWEYDTDGACKRIPYSDHMPARNARLTAWPTEERSGIIMIWHSSKAMRLHRIRRRSPNMVARIGATILCAGSARWRPSRMR